MGWVEGVVTVVTALMWPAVVVFVVLVLRRELASLVGRMSRLTAPGVEAEFANAVAATAEIAEAALPEPPTELDLLHLPELSPQPTLRDLYEENRRHPVGAIVRAWNLVESALPSDPTTASEAIRFKRLRDAGLLSDDMYGVASRLRTLRSQVVHGRVVPDAAEADEFISAAWRLAASLSEIRGLPYE